MEKNELKTEAVESMYITKPNKSSKKTVQVSKLGGGKISESRNRAKTAPKSKKNSSTRKSEKQVNSNQNRKSFYSEIELESNYNNNSNYDRQLLPPLDISNNQISQNSEEHIQFPSSTYEQLSKSQPIPEQKAVLEHKQHQQLQQRYPGSISSSAPSTFSVSGSRNSSPEKLNKLADGIEYHRAIGSPGGHIARVEDPEFQMSGSSKPPSPVKAFQFQAKHQKALLKFPTKTLLNRPGWDDRFILGSPLAEPVAKRDKTTDINGLPSVRLREEVQNYIEAKPYELYVPAPSVVVTDRMSGGGRESGGEEDAGGGQDDTMSTISMDLVLEAEQLWTTIFGELREAGADIQYAELVELASMSHPHILVESVVIYLCLLLGIKPDWETAKRSLFKQVFPLLKFIREVDPVTIPPRRLKKARRLKDTSLGALSIHSIEVLNKSASKVMRWVLAFDAIAKVILSAEKRRKQLKRSAGSARTRDDPNSDVEDPNVETVDSYMRSSSFPAGRIVTTEEKPCDVFPDRGSADEYNDDVIEKGRSVAVVQPSQPNPTFSFPAKKVEKVDDGVTVPSSPTSKGSSRQPELMLKGDGRRMSLSKLPEVPENTNISLYADMLIPGEDVVSGGSLYKQTSCYLTIKKTESVRISDSDSQYFKDLQKAKSISSINSLLE